MQRHQLEHLIRAAATVTNRYEFVIVGSQSILGSIESPPFDCLFSMEADLYALGAEELSDQIDGVLGEGSQFHETYGYYAQGVDSSTAKLPAGWESRLRRLQGPGTDDRIGYCIDVLDLFMSKCAAARPKDRDFNMTLLRAGVVDAEVALALVAHMPVDNRAQASIRSFIARLASAAKEAGPVPRKPESRSVRS